MARYIGPECRLCRRVGEKLMLKGERCFTPKCAVERRGTLPGDHGPSRRRRRVSDRGLQLKEKQKARFTYGVLERQFRKYFAEALRKPGVTGEMVFQLLERRLDNVVYRLGFADSRSQARQWVRHGFFTVNGHKCDIPSRLVRVGDAIGWKEGSTKLEHYKQVARDIKNKQVPGWLSLDLQTLAGRVAKLPGREDIASKINDQAIVAYYSR
ncbi:MAG: 30S ribosomal protein S4 [Chloroflexi bacterium]|nr:30S ribosomal protein S4 [Chloroflexota bacterium]